MYRTKVCDPEFGSEASARIAEIPTKDYANLIFPNITDVSYLFPLQWCVV